MLDDFSRLDMIEQITLLEEIRAQGRTECIPALAALYSENGWDTAVDEMLYHTLFDLLGRRPQAVFTGLEHQDPRIRTLCVRRLHHPPMTGGGQALLALLRREEDPALIADILRALETYASPELVDELVPLTDHTNGAVAGAALNLLARIPCPAARDHLAGLAGQALADLGPADDCDLRLGLALQGLARFPEPEVVAFLVAQLAHPNPVARRLVEEALAQLGPAALAGLGRALTGDDRQVRLRACRILGRTHTPAAADLLAGGLAAETDPEVRSALYQALSNLGQSGSDGVDLTSGLDDEDEIALIAILHTGELTGDRQLEESLRQRFLTNPEAPQNQRLADALVVSRATSLFSRLLSTPALRPVLAGAVRRCDDRQAAADFTALMAEQEPELEADARATSEQTAAPPSQRLLVVDDSVAMQLFYRACGGELGLEVVTEASGDAALALLDKEGPAFHGLVTELALPGLSGIELIRGARRRHPAATLPILVATVEWDPAQLEMAGEAGADACLVKPFTRDAFAAALRRLLPS